MYTTAIRYRGHTKKPEDNQKVKMKSLLDESQREMQQMKIIY